MRNLETLFIRCALLSVGAFGLLGVLIVSLGILQLFVSFSVLHLIALLGEIFLFFFLLFAIALYGYTLVPSRYLSCEE